MLIEKYNWQPTLFTETGLARVDEKVLSGLDYPEAKLLNESLMLQKRLGQLAEGANAWLKLSKNGVIHGRVNHMGAVTSRCTHSNPNTGQIPSVSAPYGSECRSLFHAPTNYMVMGCDVSGLELRCLLISWLYMMTVSMVIFFLTEISTRQIKMRRDYPAAIWLRHSYTVSYMGRVMKRLAVLLKGQKRVKDQTRVSKENPCP